MKEHTPYILCTAPVTEIQRRQAREAGVCLDGIPFTETRKRDTEEIREKIASILSEKITLLFTSANAVEAVAGFCGKGQSPSSSLQPIPAEDIQREIPETGTHENFPQGKGIKSGYASPYAGWDIYVVGKNTAGKVKTYFPGAHIKAVSAYSSTLAEKIRKEPPAQKLLFFCGNIHREELPATLRKNGYDLEEIVVYDTVKIPQPVNQYYDGIIFFSPGAAASYFSVNKPLEGQYFFSIGQTTENELKTYTRLPIIVSPQQDKQVLIDTAIRFFSSKQNI